MLLQMLMPTSLKNMKKKLRNPPKLISDSLFLSSKCFHLPTFSPMSWSVSPKTFLLSEWPSTAHFSPQSWTWPSYHHLPTPLTRTMPGLCSPV